MGEGLWRRFVLRMLVGEEHQQGRGNRLSEDLVDDHGGGRIHAGFLNGLFVVFRMVAIDQGSEHNDCGHQNSDQQKKVFIGKSHFHKFSKLPLLCQS